MSKEDFTIEEEKVAVEAGYTYLVKAAQERRVVKLAEFEVHIFGATRIMMNWHLSHVLRHEINLVSIKEKACVIELILVQEDGTPCNRAFEMTWCNNLYRLPENETGLNFDRVAVTKKLQKVIFDTYASEGTHE